MTRLFAVMAEFTSSTKKTLVTNKDKAKTGFYLWLELLV